MTYVFYVDNVRKVSDNRDDVPWLKISSPNDEIPAFENTQNGCKHWCEKDLLWHRLNGPAIIWPNGHKQFYLKDQEYKNINQWLNAHPNQDENFKKEMHELWG
jgi:hypothetical protein